MPKSRQAVLNSATATPLTLLHTLLILSLYKQAFCMVEKRLHFRPGEHREEGETPIRKL